MVPDLKYHEAVLEPWAWIVIWDEIRVGLYDEFLFFLRNNGWDFYFSPKNVGWTFCCTKCWDFCAKILWQEGVLLNRGREDDFEMMVTKRSARCRKRCQETIRCRIS